MTPATIVVPCFNEADRLDQAAFLDFARRPGVSLLFVDDGSSDATADVIAKLSAGAESIDFLVLPHNQGKGEAVRQGMRRALDAGARAVGYFDADMSTPVEECTRLMDELDDPALEVILGARIAMLGTRIERQALRHYVSRVFATGASMVLQCAVYDTQCGAKVFRRSPVLDAALETPFSSRWAFDVELIGRLMIGAPGVPGLPIQAIKEVPLLRWTHVGGSKLRPLAMFKAAAELGRIAWALEEAKKRARGS
jgi:glycosyltransferase involved in cell wall biosynthesis